MKPPHMFIDEIAGENWTFETIMASVHVGEYVILDGREYLVIKIIHDNKRLLKDRQIKYHVRLDG